MGDCSHQFVPIINGLSQTDAHLSDPDISRSDECVRLPAHLFTAWLLRHQDQGQWHDVQHYLGSAMRSGW